MPLIKLETTQLTATPDSIPSPVWVAFCSTFVKNYQGKITLSSTNVTKVYTDIDMPEIVAMRESVLYAGSLMLDHGDILRSRLRKANHQSIFSICQMGSVMSGCYCQHVQGHRHQCDA